MLACPCLPPQKGKALGSGPQLQLSNVMREAAGNYICEVTMPGVQGLSRNKQALVVVYGKGQTRPRLCQPQSQAACAALPSREEEKQRDGCRGIGTPILVTAADRGPVPDAT